MIPRRLIPIITFSIILLLSLAQIFWWVYFQIRQTKTVVSLHSQVGVLWEEKIEHELDNAVRRHHRAAGARNDFDHASFIRDWMATNAAEYEWDSIAFAASGKILIHSKQQQIVLDEANRRLVMFISEGAFFSIMVLAGIYFLYYTFKKEIQLQVLQTNFILSVTHELRSPLASIKLYLQSLLRSNVPDQKREMFLKHGLEDADRLHRLLENLLNAARMEEKKVIYHKRPIDLSQTLGIVGQSWQSRLGEEIQWTIEISNDISIRADEDALQSVLDNFMENAVKYATAPKKITIRLRSVAPWAIIDFSDNGDGVNPNEEKLIFQKFYRSENEMTRRTKGIGLGLYLAGKIVKDHQGLITVARDETLGGAKFTVRWPLA